MRVYSFYILARTSFSVLYQDTKSINFQQDLDIIIILKINLEKMWASKFDLCLKHYHSGKMLLLNKSGVFYRLMWRHVVSSFNFSRSTLGIAQLLLIFFWIWRTWPYWTRFSLAKYHFCFHFHRLFQQ